MQNAFCLLNHKLTSNQEAELHNSFGAERIIYPPPEVAELWSAIPTDREITKAHLAPFTGWLQEAAEGDIVILQGEFSATFALTDFSFHRGLIPVCAVSKRITVEEKEGEKVKKQIVFEHICFRQYRITMI
jgi:hypothetical protein